MKKIMFMIFVVLMVIIIYVLNQDKKVYYLSLGDDLTLGRTYENDFVDSFSVYISKYLEENKKLEKSVNSYATLNHRTTDIYNDIINNVKKSINNEEIAIKNAIIKADLITISAGLNDFMNYIDDYKIIRDNIVTLRQDMEKLLKELRKICKEKIILVGIYNPNTSDDNLEKVLRELNSQYEIISNKYDVYYLNIFDEMENNINRHGKFPTESGYKMIFENLKKYIEDVII